MNIWQRIFTLTNEGPHKLLIILGIKIRMKRKGYKTEQMLKEIQKDVATLKALTVYSTDITKLKPAAGVLASIQNINARILAEVDRVCKENNLTYWLSFGSLLGAVRHKGYIPWDDDIDVVMIREDYDRFIEIFKKSTINPHYTAELYSHPEGIFNLLKVYDNRNRDSLFVDIFPCDFYYKENMPYEEKVALTDKLKDLHSKEKRKAFNPGNGVTAHHNYYRELTKKIIFDNYQKEKTSKPMILLGGEYFFWHFESWFFDWDEIFPLSEIEFCGRMFPCPNQTNKVLHLIYRDYMAMPDRLKCHSDYKKFGSEEIIKLEEIENDK